jgi:hypothetical protein
MEPAINKDTATHYRSVLLRLPRGSPYGRDMGYQRLAYAEQDTTGQMHDDCLACTSQIRVPHEPVTAAPVALEVPRQRTRLEVSAPTADLAARLLAD